jgi:uncharacterized membrane protein HdeD (DUF308 family)
MSAAARTVISAGPSRGWKIAFGVLTVICGVLILVWPGAAVLTVAVILGIQLIVAGVVRTVTAFTADVDRALVRVLYVLLGLVLIGVGVAFLAAPLGAAAFLVLLFGLSWILNGVIELFHGFTGGGGWTIAAGAVSLIAGVAVLTYPASGVLAAAWLLGLALIAIGLTVGIGALVRNSSAAREAAGGRRPEDRKGGVDAAT